MNGRLHDGGGSEAEWFWEGTTVTTNGCGAGRLTPLLVDVAGARPADTALDLGCGEGGDAIWLARQGWRVTAVGVSATALERAASHAANRQRRRGQTLHAVTAPSVRRKPLRL